MEHFEFNPTPIYYAKNISKKLGVNIYFKRDDLFELGGGGNKARKLQYILYKLQRNNYNAIVTAGDINSNHNRATAILGAVLGVKVTLVVHNEHPEFEYKSANMKLARLCNANVVYCAKKDVSIVMDNAMEKYKNEGFYPYYIWGGGHSLEGSYAFYDAILELKEQIKFTPDYIYFASGTGTTHAGIHVGAKKTFDKTKVVGISIARDKERGSLEIYKSIVELEELLKVENSKKTELSEINFDDAYISKGYESSNDEIDQVIKKVANMDGILLDPTYTGKAFWGLCNHIKRGIIRKESNIVFWHTGGLLNLISK